VNKRVKDPNEAHGYRARESIHHTLAEMLDRADRYIKNAGKAAVRGRLEGYMIPGLTPRHVYVRSDISDPRGSVAASTPNV
jgi:hypothetical protein